MEVPKKAFILAGGKGERLRPLTLENPKPMLPVKGRPILEWNVSRLAGFGVKEIVLGVNYLHEKIGEHFGDGEKWGVKIIYNVEDGFLGTGGALKHAEKLLMGGRRFMMLNGDNLADVDYGKMLEMHEKNHAAGTLALVEVENPKKFGLVELGEPGKGGGNKITEFLEKPEGEIGRGTINAGAYILEREVFDLLPPGFSLIETTAFPALAAGGKLYGYMHRGQFFATDTLERYTHACGNWEG